MKTTIIKTPEQCIIEHLELNGQKMSWLAAKMGLTLGHLHSVLKGKGNKMRELTADNRKKINEILNTNY